MANDTWVVRWKDQLSETYLYGSEVKFHEDGAVSFYNPMMPPGTVIHRWYSKTNYQRNRIEPSLPLIDGEKAYCVSLNIDEHDASKASVLLRIVFYDRYDDFADSIIIREKRAYFKPSIKTYSYCMELVNGGNADFTFKSFTIEEVSKKEFDEEQKRIEKVKEASYKSEKKWRKAKSSDRRGTKRSDGGSEAKISKR